jgi:hypothetical protein
MTSSIALKTDGWPALIASDVKHARLDLTDIVCDHLPDDDDTVDSIDAMQPEVEGVKA